jgi:hypothetical protein
LIKTETERRRIMVLDTRGLEPYVNPNGSAWIGHTRVMVIDNDLAGSVLVRYPDGRTDRLDRSALTRNRPPLLPVR